MKQIGKQVKNNQKKIKRKKIDSRKMKEIGIKAIKENKPKSRINTSGDKQKQEKDAKTSLNTRKRLKTLYKQRKDKKRKQTKK